MARCGGAVFHSTSFFFEVFSFLIPIKVLAMLGLLGAPIAALQLAILEREELASFAALSAQNSGGGGSKGGATGAAFTAVGVPAAGFAAALFLFYSGEFIFFPRGGAEGDPSMP